MRTTRSDGWFRTLRFRLAFWNTSAMLVLVGLTLLGVWCGLWATLLSELDKQLAEDSEEVAMILRDNPHDLEGAAVELERHARSHQDHGWFVQLYEAGREGGPAWASRSTPPPPLPPPGRHSGTAAAPGYRFLTRYITAGDWHVTVRVGTRLDEIQHDLGRLTELLVVVGLLLIVVVPVSGYWLAGRATRPLADIVRTAKRLRPSQLDERLPVLNTGDELDRLSVTVNGFLDRLAEYLTRKGDFIANAAHELRSPLAAIRASAEVALHSDRSAEEYRDLLGEIVERCDNLTTLVNQLLLLAEGDAGRLQPGGGWVDLGTLVLRAVDMFDGVADVRGVTLTADVPEPVRLSGEATHLRQVLHNLLDNAIKFTPSGGCVTVGLHLDRNRRVAVLTVRDTGAGIPPEDLPRVCERFYRGDKARQSAAGRPSTGLGLSICQSIVEAYGGKITFSSTLGKGTEARVELPDAEG